jgi:hypothetical protein
MKKTRRPNRSWSRIALIAVLVITAGTVWWGMLRSPSGPAQPAQAADTLGQRLPDEGFQHVREGSAITYQAHPPASGPHYPVPAQTGVYPGGLATGYWVHSMEHGYIVLVYKPPVSADVLAAFQQMVRDFPPSKFGNVKLVVAPYPDMPHKFAVLSWDWRLVLDTLDREKILEFYRAHVDHGREDIP